MKSRGHSVTVCLGIALAGAGCAQILGFDEEPPPISNAGGSGVASSVSSSSSTGSGGNAGMGGNGGMAGSGMCPPDVCNDGAIVKCTASDCSVSASASFAFGGVEHQSIRAMAVPSVNGGIVLGGDFAGTLNFGSGVTLAESPTAIHPFIAQLDSNGVGVVAYSLPESGAMYGVATDPTGAALYGTGIIFDPGSPKQKRIFIQKFGASSWTHEIGNDDANNSAGIARGGPSHVFAAGNFQGTVSTPNCPEITNYTATTVDSLVMQFDEVDGSCTWATKISNSYARSIAATSGSVVVGGFYSGVIDLPLAPVTNDFASFFVVYQAKTHVIMAKTFLVPESGGEIYLVNVALDPSDSQSVYMTAIFRGTLDANGRTLVSTGGGTDPDMIVGKFDSVGKVVWINRFGGLGEQVPHSITPFGGNIFISGTTAQNMALAADTDSGPLCTASKCMFLLKLSAETGAPIWGRTFGNMEMSGDPTAISAADATTFWLGGGWSSTINFGGGDLLSPMASGQDIVFAKFTTLP